MAWSFTNLHYGWKIAVGISLAAATIFIVSNTRERVNQADIIELVLGTAERCLAADIAPPSFVRSWYSNSYVTTNVPGDAATNWTAQLYTNTFTNVIGWRTDRAMMVELDAKIKELVPLFINTNTIFGNTNDISQLTITGVWASLGIGDGTNQFTSVPASGTNVATYGALPWRIYKEDLEERYKVLSVLKYNELFRTSIHHFRKTGSGTAQRHDDWHIDDWYTSESDAQSAYVTNSWVDYTGVYGYNHFTYSVGQKGNYFNYWYWYSCAFTRGTGYVTCVLTDLQTNILESLASLSVKVHSVPYVPGEFASHGVPGIVDGWGLVSTITDISSISNNLSTCDVGTQPDDYVPPPTSLYPYDVFKGNNQIGWRILAGWNFLYCTNKYW